MNTKTPAKPKVVVKGRKKTNPVARPCMPLWNGG